MEGSTSTPNRKGKRMTPTEFEQHETRCNRYRQLTHAIAQTENQIEQVKDKSFSIDTPKINASHPTHWEPIKEANRFDNVRHELVKALEHRLLELQSELHSL